MANYYGYTRTNHFSVTDPEKLKDIVDRIRWSEGDSPFFSEENGKYCFGAYDTIMGLSMKKDRAAQAVDAEDDAYDEDEERDVDKVYYALQEIVAPDDAIIITEIGYEKLRYLTAYSIIITESDVASVDLGETAVQRAADILGNPDYQTRMEY